MFLMRLFTKGNYSCTRCDILMNFMSRIIHIQFNGLRCNGYQDMAEDICMDRKKEGDNNELKQFFLQRALNIFFKKGGKSLTIKSRIYLKARTGCFIKLATLLFFAFKLAVLSVL